jgi:RimJ/RimL family protein N-acetyltransferase
MFSDCYHILVDNQMAGYVIESEENSLIEFFVSNNFSKQRVTIFNQVVKMVEVKRIYCQSYDAQLLDCCLTNELPYKVVGCLFRDFVDNGLTQKPELSFRFATKSDLPFFQQQDDEVFEPQELLEKSVQNKEIVVLQDTDSSIIGCGFITRIHKDFTYFDLGVWVSPEHREKGFATQIMLYLKGLCNANGWEAICGCDIKNTASQNMLRKLGFISNYKLLEFSCLGCHSVR